ncbi:MAG: hypothetical protein KBS74_03755 [Clostridiales bacterium]|nr:hypothetical protein [Candidatus Cacconaster stercorequi]
MTRVHCKACGKRYHYETNGCCPECGAYNRPPHRRTIGADGVVHKMTDRAFLDADSPLHDRKQGKVCFEEKECYEEKSCFEEQAQKVRKKAAIPAIDGIDFSKLRLGGAKGKKSNPTAVGVLIIFAIILGIVGDLLSDLNWVDGEPDYIWSDDDSWSDQTYSGWLDEPFTLNGNEICVTDWRIFGDELQFLIQGSDDLDVELSYLNIHGDDNFITDFDCESLDSGGIIVDTVVPGKAIWYKCPVKDVWAFEELILIDGDEAAYVALNMYRKEVDESFDWQEAEVCVEDYSAALDGVGSVLDDLIVTVQMDGMDWDEDCLPQLWLLTQNGTPWTFDAESWDGETLRYNTQEWMKPKGVRMTLYFPDYGDGAYWVELQ